MDYKNGSSAEHVFDMQDGQGNIRLCFRCNKSTYGGRMMMSCDHCPLHWHLDCLCPPMASPPPSTRKWMCPNHVDHILVSVCSARELLLYVNFLYLLHNGNPLFLLIVTQRKNVPSQERERKG